MGKPTGAEVALEAFEALRRRNGAWQGQRSTLTVSANGLMITPEKKVVCFPRLHAELAGKAGYGAGIVLTVAFLFRQMGSSTP